MLQTSPLYAYIPTNDLERARRFYEGKLGFKPTLENNGGVTYACAGGNGLLPVPDAKRWHLASQPGVLSVADIEREGADLKHAASSRGLRHARREEPERRHRRGGANAWFKDRRGQLMAIIQTL